MTPVSPFSTHSKRCTFPRTPVRRLASAAAAALFLAAIPSFAQMQAEPPPGGATPPAESTPISQAEKLVFTTNQLGNVKAPERLRYSYVKRGSLEAGFEDSVTIDVKAPTDGRCCTTDGKFLTGTREMKLPEVDAATANPVTLYFLEHDVREMSRLTKGQSAYFRKRIRLALVDQAKITPTKVRYGGREVAADEVRVTPYVNDPLRNRFEQLSSKEYIFVLAPSVPGGVYQLRTLVAGKAGSEAPVAEEVMTLDAPATTQR
jgi:hypothetical protein